MKSSLVVKAVKRFTDNAEVATVLGSNPASSYTVESEGRQVKQCWIQYIEKEIQKFPHVKFTWDMMQDQQRELEAVKQEKIKMERELTRQENTGRHLFFSIVSAFNYLLIVIF